MNKRSQTATSLQGADQNAQRRKVYQLSTQQSVVPINYKFELFILLSFKSAPQKTMRIIFKLNFTVFYIQPENI